MNTQKDRQVQGVSGRENSAGNRDRNEDKGRKPSQTGAVPSEVDTEEALERDNLHEDSSLKPDTPGEY